MVKNSKLVGQSIIAYLQKKGYPEVSVGGSVFSATLIFYCLHLFSGCPSLCEGSADQVLSSTGVRSHRGMCVLMHACVCMCMCVYV